MEPEEPPRSKGGMIALGVLLVVALLLAGGGAYVLTHTHHAPVSAVAQPTATPAATAIPMRTITDDTAKIKFNIPQEWVSRGSATATDGFQAGSPDHKNAIGVFATSINSGGSLNQAGLAKSALAGGANYTPVTDDQGPATVTMGGESWARAGGTFTRDNIQAHGVVLVTVRNNTMYLFVLIAEVETYDAVSATVLPAFEQSFTFLP
jgi:hypothetical protein